MRVNKPGNRHIDAVFTPVQRPAARGRCLFLPKDEDSSKYTGAAEDGNVEERKARVSRRVALKPLVYKGVCPSCAAAPGEAAVRRREVGRNAAAVTHEADVCRESLLAGFLDILTSNGTQTAPVPCHLLRALNKCIVGLHAESKRQAGTSGQVFW